MILLGISLSCQPLQELWWNGYSCKRDVFDDGKGAGSTASPLSWGCVLFLWRDSGHWTALQDFMLCASFYYRFLISSSFVLGKLKISGLLSCWALLQKMCMHLVKKSEYKLDNLQQGVSIQQQWYSLEGKDRQTTGSTYLDNKRVSWWLWHAV